jgi:hypothetical protein
MADEPENLTLLHLRAIDIKAWPRTCARSRPGLASWSSSTPRSRPASTKSMPGSIASESARSVPRHVAWGKNKTALEREGPQGDQAAKSTTLRICKLSRAVRASTPWSAFNFSVRIPLLVVFNVTTSDVPKSIRCHSTPRGDIPVQRQFPPTVDRPVFSAREHMPVFLLPIGPAPACRPYLWPNLASLVDNQDVAGAQDKTPGGHWRFAVDEFLAGHEAP